MNSLKRGGILVYSTCTISPDENEYQVYWILKTFPDLQLSEQVHCIIYIIIIYVYINRVQLLDILAFQDMD